LADQVLLKITYLIMRWLFGLAVLVSRGDQEKNAELLVLRHENAVLRRNAGRVRYEPPDRAWFAVLTRFIPRHRRAEVFPVTPATLLAWHRKLAARKYDTSKRRQPGRPPTIRSIARLTVRLAKENPFWGFRFLIRDRGSNFTASFDAVFQADTRQIHRKPALSGLINEYTRAA
jgi:hypothetical protein